MRAELRKQSGRRRRQARVWRRIRRKPERHVLKVYRSLKHVYAQIIDPTGRTMFSVSTLSKSLQGKIKPTGGVEAGRKVGAEIARMALERNIQKVIFDRNGFIFHGRVKALADTAREAGLKF